MDKLKLGVIGVGGIAQNRHIPALQKLNHLVEIVGVQDINQELAKKYHHNFKFQMSFQNMRRCLKV